MLVRFLLDQTTYPPHTHEIASLEVGGVQGKWFKVIRTVYSKEEINLFH